MAGVVHSLGGSCTHNSSSAHRRKRARLSEEKTTSASPPPTHMLGAARAGAAKCPAAVKQYQRSYKGGAAHDFHFPLFSAVRELTRAKSVWYPGCHRHLTASLVFPEVHYQDCDRRVQPAFASDVLKYISAHKTYSTKPRYTFTLGNYESKAPKDAGTVDLLLSLSAGLVSQSCTPTMRVDSYLLASDAHSDARLAYLSGMWDLVAVWKGGDLSSSADDLAQCFRVKGTGKPISRAQVEESIQIGAVAKRSFRLEHEHMFYLFRRRRRRARDHRRSTS